MNPLQVAAFAAGLFDGEGSISIAYRVRHRGYTHHRLIISLSSTDPRITDWFKEYFGGRVYTRQPRKIEYSRVYQWILHGENSETFLKAIDPYLLSKREQVTIALDFLKTMRQGVKISLEIFDLRNNMRLKLSEINHCHQNYGLREHIPKR